MEDNLTQQISERLQGIADIIAVFSSRKEVLIKGILKIDNESGKREIESRLTDPKSNIEVISTDPYMLVRLRRAEQKTGTFPWINLVLFLATGLTTIMTGALWEGIDWISDPGLIIDNPLAILFGGLPFSLSLLAILAFHEFGHYFASRFHGINATLPYFIPAPPFINPFGTFGAVIKSKSAYLNRRQLLDVGAAGPLSGLVIAIIVLFIGVNGSTVEPVTDNIANLFFGESLLFRIIAFILKGSIGDNEMLVINSVGLAGWGGLLVTMLNLIPLGQLDGGHIAYAMFGKFQNKIAIMAVVGLAALSFYWPGWLLLIIFGILMKFKHPPTIMDELPLGRGRKIIGVISFIVFILCFMPAPIYLNS